MIRLRGGRKTQDADDQRFASSGKAVRFFYGALVLGAVLTLAYWAAKPLIFLEGVGTVEAPEQQISFPHVAEVKIIAVRPGQEVHRGTVLAILKRSDAEAVSQSLEQRLYNAESSLRDLENRLLVATEARGPAQSRVGAARSTMDRIAKADQRFVSANYVANMQREYSEAADRLAVLNADAQTLPSAISGARDEILSLRNELMLIDRTWSHIQLTSSYDGNIGPEIAAEGSTVVPGQNILSVYDESKKFLLWRLPAFSLAEPRRGDKVSIAFGRQTYSGKVSRILSISDVAQSSGRMVEVEIEGNQSRLPLGASVKISLTYFDIPWLR